MFHAPDPPDDKSQYANDAESSNARKNDGYRYGQFAVVGGVL